MYFTFSDANTFFRGNTLVTKLIDELMKLVGLPYLHDTLKPIIAQVRYMQRVSHIVVTKQV